MGRLERRLRWEGALEGSGKGTLRVNETCLRGKAAQELLVLVGWLVRCQ